MAHAAHYRLPAECFASNRQQRLTALLLFAGLAPRLGCAAPRILYAIAKFRVTSDEWRGAAASERHLACSSVFNHSALRYNLLCDTPGQPNRFPGSDRP